MEKILIVDDEPAMRMALREVLRRREFEVLEADGGVAALEVLEREPDAQLVISDVRMPEMSGTELLKVVSTRFPAVSFIVMTAYGTVEDAVEAMRTGARDYILKPFTGDAIVEAINRVLRQRNGNGTNEDSLNEEEAEPGGNGSGRSNSRKTHGSGRLVFADSAMARIVELLDEISDSQATVLFEGESGTGKEVLARYLHQQSPRRDKPFVAVNCAALPEGLLESELFGHEKGSFTGAIQSRKGKFELANGGTLLLDEISEMPVSLQAKLLRVLQEHEIDPVGARSPVSIDIRVVATTNSDLEAAVRAGDFREDLYYRLNVIRVKVPALRARRGDVLPLAEYFLKKHCKRNHRPAKRFGRETIERLFAQPWHGNVRELENFVERAVLLCKDEEITPQKIFLDGGIAVAAPSSDIKTAPSPTTFASEPIEAGAIESSDPAVALIDSHVGLPVGASVGFSVRTPFNSPVDSPVGPDLSSSGGSPVSSHAGSSVGASGTTVDSSDTFITLEEMEKRLILNTLEKVGGNRTRAADLLGVSVRTIRNKLSLYRLPVEAP